MSLSEYKLVGTVPPTYCSDPMETMEVWAIDNVGKTHIAAQFKIKYIDTVYCCNADKWRLSKQFGTNFDSCETLCEYNGNLYAGTANNSGVVGYAKAWTYNDYTDTWSISIGFSGNTVEVMHIYNNKLYVGTGDQAGTAYIYSYDGTNWNYETNFLPSVTRVNSMEHYSVNDKLYVGCYSTTAGLASLKVYDGSIWVSLAPLSNAYLGIKCMKEYNGLLYLGMWSVANNYVLINFDGGATYNVVDTFGTGKTIRCMEVHNSKLYMGTGSDNGCAELWCYDGATVSKIHDFGTGFYRVESLKSFNSKLYMGLGNTTGCGRVYSYNGSTFTLEKQFNPATVEQVEFLESYNSRLYAGLGRDGNSAAVWMLDT